MIPSHSKLYNHESNKIVRAFFIVFSAAILQRFAQGWA